MVLPTPIPFGTSQYSRALRSPGGLESPTRSPGPRRLAPGFTLVELMTVVALVAILATLAAPSLRDFLIRNRSAAISNELVASVMRAKSEAVSRNSCVSMCSSTLAPATSTSLPTCDGGSDWRSGWIAFTNPNCNAATTPSTPAEIVIASGPFNSSFTLTSSATNNSRIMFSPSGNLNPGDVGSFNLQYLSETRSSNRSICLNSMARTRLVALNASC